MRKQKSVRIQILADKKAANKRLRDNNKLLADANLKIEKVEVEVGPLKYIAELIYGEQAKDHLDSTVRIMILLLVFVFDPLALMLLIAASRKSTPEVIDGDSVLFKKDDILDLEK